MDSSLRLENMSALNEPGESSHIVYTSAEAELKLRMTNRRTWRIIADTVSGTLISLLLASVLIFFSLHILPGDPAVILGGTDATPAQIQQIRVENGWDRPVVIQYLDWVQSILHGDFGTSPFTGKSVTSELLAKLQVTLPLTLTSLTIAIVAALIIGVFAAVQAQTVIGRFVSWTTVLGIAIPTFVLGVVLIAWIAIPSGGVIPATGFPRGGWREPGEAIVSLILPSATLAIPLTAQLTRFVRSAVLEQLSQPYMQTARAQGMSKKEALWTHALRNALLPLIAVVALDAAGLLMGTILVEQVFALSGVGQTIVSAVSNRDIVTVQGFLMVLSATIILLMMGSNLAVRLIDPRTRVPV